VREGSVRVAGEQPSATCTIKPLGHGNTPAALAVQATNPNANQPLYAGTAAHIAAGGGFGVLSAVDCCRGHDRVLSDGCSKERQAGRQVGGWLAAVAACAPMYAPGRGASTTWYWWRAAKRPPEQRRQRQQGTHGCLRHNGSHLQASKGIKAAAGPPCTHKGHTCWGRTVQQSGLQANRLYRGWWMSRLARPAHSGHSTAGQGQQGPVGEQQACGTGAPASQQKARCSVEIHAAECWPLPQAPLTAMRLQIWPEPPSRHCSGGSVPVQQGSDAQEAARRRTCCSQGKER